MRLEINEDRQLIVNGVVLTRVAPSTAEDIHHFLFAHYLIGCYDAKYNTSDVIDEAEKILLAEDAQDQLCDIEDDIEMMGIGDGDD